MEMKQPCGDGGAWLMCGRAFVGWPAACARRCIKKDRHFRFAALANLRLAAALRESEEPVPFDAPAGYLSSGGGLAGEAFGEYPQTFYAPKQHESNCALGGF